MIKKDKAVIIDELTKALEENNIVYLTNTEGLNAQETSNFRRACFKGNIQVKVIKNTLLKIAMENVEGKDFSEMYKTLKGNTTLMLAEKGSEPAKLIKNFRKKNTKPEFKAAYIEEAVYIGEENLESLTQIKSKEELVADIVALLQSPIKNVVSSLESSKQTLAGLVKTLSEK